MTVGNRVKAMASLEEMLGLDPQSPDMLRAEFLVTSDRELLHRLVEVRRERGLSQGQVGELMGVSQPTVAAFEAHDSNPRLSTIRRYAHAVQALVEHSVTSDHGQLVDGSWVSAGEFRLSNEKADYLFAEPVRVALPLGVVDSFRGSCDSARDEFALVA